jgi:SAM-dependent methyltransferase
MTRRLELGSGYNPYRPDNPEWEHAEIAPGAPHVEHALDVFGPLPFADGTFAELRAVDILEHTSYRRTDAVLAEWARVLAPGGRFTVMVPDAETIMVRYASDPQGLVVPEFADQPPIVSAAWRLFGGHDDGRYLRDGNDWRWNAHFAAFSEASLRWHLDRAGLDVERIERNGHPNLIATAIRRPA